MLRRIEISSNEYRNGQLARGSRRIVESGAVRLHEPDRQLENFQNTPEMKGNPPDHLQSVLIENKHSTLDSLSGY
jgi:hypothetical protein